MEMLYIYVGTCLPSIVVHMVMGWRLKRRFKTVGLSESLDDYYIQYKGENKSIKYYAKYLVYICPLLNVFIAIIEITHFNKVFSDVLKDVKDFDKKRKKEIA